MTKPDAFIYRKEMLSRPEGRAKTVLLAEDEPENLKIISEILKELGHHALGFRDAPAALSGIREGCCPDLVITDYQMPGMNGIEFLARLRNVLPGVPVIMMTAYGDLDSYFKAFSLGVFEYVNKPVTKTEFERIVNAALGGNNQKPPQRHREKQIGN